LIRGHLLLIKWETDSPCRMADFERKAEVQQTFRGGQGAKGTKGRGTGVGWGGGGNCITKVRVKKKEKEWISGENPSNKGGR